MSDRRLEEALRHLDPPPGRGLWHGGATVLGALRGTSAELAAWTPYPDRHSIWGLALHVAYWNYAVRRRLEGSEETGGFPRSPANFPAVPEDADEAAWKADRGLVKEEHDRLVEVVRGFDADRLDERAPGRKGWSWADMITGIVLHDTYHAGQINMMKRLAGSAGVD